MSQLAQLRQKIRSIQTTKKITHAVRLISMSFYNKLEKMHTPLKQYTHAVHESFGFAGGNSTSWTNPVLSPRDVYDARPLIVVVATAKGLCGSLNANLFRYLDQTIFVAEGQHPVFIAIGQKAIHHLKDTQHELLVTYPEVTTNNFIALADELVDKIMNAPQPYTSVAIFHNEARSFFLQRPLKSTVIPLALMPQENALEQAPANQEVIWEQDRHEVLDFLALRHLRSSIIYIFFQAIRAEHAARFMAMENSTNNAQKFLERLTLQFNKLRQALITKEIAELSSGLPRQQ